MSEHIHLSVPKCKSKNCKIAQELEEKLSNWNSVISHRKVKQSMIKVCMVHCTWKENDYQWKKERIIFICSEWIFLSLKSLFL